MFENLIEYLSTGVPVLELDELLDEFVVFRPICIFGAFDVLYGIDDFIRCQKNRIRRLGLQINIKAAQVIAIIFQIIGKENHWLTLVAIELLDAGVVEHDARIVRNQHVSNEIEVRDARNVRQIDDARHTPEVGDPLPKRG